MLFNLVSNAVKYSAAGTPVAIRGTASPTAVTVSVEDQGSGIDPHDMPHVFDRFYRGSDAAKRTKGAGLGLYLVKAIVEAHSGRVWVESAPERGSIFMFTLPAR